MVRPPRYSPLDPPTSNRGNTAAFYSCIGDCRIANIDISAQLFSKTDRYPQGPVAIDFNGISTAFHSGCLVEAPQVGRRLFRNRGAKGGSETRINTYRAPMIVTTVAPKLVAKTPHCPTAGTMEAEAIATNIFLTPLDYDEQNVKAAWAQGCLHMGRYDLCAVCVYNVHVVSSS